MSIVFKNVSFGTMVSSCLIHNFSRMFRFATVKAQVNFSRCHHQAAGIHDRRVAHLPDVEPSNAGLHVTWHTPVGVVIA